MTIQSPMAQVDSTHLPLKREVHRAHVAEDKEVAQQRHAVPGRAMPREGGWPAGPRLVSRDHTRCDRVQRWTRRGLVDQSRKVIEQWSCHLAARPIHRAQYTVLCNTAMWASLRYAALEGVRCDHHPERPQLDVAKRGLYIAPAGKVIGTLPCICSM